MLKIGKLTIGCASFLACVYVLNGTPKDFKNMSIADFKNYLQGLVCGKRDQYGALILWDDAHEDLKKKAQIEINQYNNYNNCILQAKNGQLGGWFQKKEQEGYTQNGLIEAWRNVAKEAQQQYLSIVNQDRQEHFQTLKDSISGDYMLPWQQKVAKIFVAEWEVSAHNNRGMQDNNNLWSGTDNQTLKGFETIYDANKNKDNRKEIMSLFREDENFDAFKTRFALDDQTDAGTIRIIQQLHNLYTNFNKQNKEDAINIQKAFDAIGTPFKDGNNKKAVLALLSENVTVDTLKDVYLLNDQDDARTIQRLQQISDLYRKIKARNSNANIQDFYNWVEKKDEFWNNVDALHNAIEGKNIDYLKNFSLFQVYKSELALYGLKIDKNFNFNDEDIAKLRDLGQYSPFFLKWLFFPENGSEQLFNEYKTQKEKFTNLKNYSETVNIERLTKYFNAICNEQGNNLFNQDDMTLYPSVFWFILKDQRMYNRHPLLQPGNIDYDALLNQAGFKDHLSYVANRIKLENKIGSIDLDQEEKQARIGWLKMVCEPHFNDTINSLRNENNSWESIWQFIQKESNNLQKVLTSKEGLAFVHKNLPAKTYHYLKVISVMGKGWSWTVCADLFEEGEVNYDVLMQNKQFVSIIKNQTNRGLLIKALQEVDWLTNEVQKARIGWLKMVCEPHFNDTINSLRNENNPWESMWQFIENENQATENLQKVLTSEEGLAFVHKNLPAKAYHCLKAISVMGKGFSWFLCTDLFEEGLNYDNLERNEDFQKLIKDSTNVSLLVKALNAADWLDDNERAKKLEFILNGGKKPELELSDIIHSKLFNIEKAKKTKLRRLSQDDIVEFETFDPIFYVLNQNLDPIPMACCYRKYVENITGDMETLKREGCKTLLKFFRAFYGDGQVENDNEERSVSEQIANNQILNWENIENVRYTKTMKTLFVRANLLKFFNNRNQGNDGMISHGTKDNVTQNGAFDINKNRVIFILEAMETLTGILEHLEEKTKQELFGAIRVPVFQAFMHIQRHCRSGVADSLALLEGLFLKLIKFNDLLSIDLCLKNLYLKYIEMFAEYFSYALGTSASDINVVAKVEGSVYLDFYGFFFNYSKGKVKYSNMSAINGIDENEISMYKGGFLTSLTQDGNFFGLSKGQTVNTNNVTFQDFVYYLFLKSADIKNLIYGRALYELGEILIEDGNLNQQDKVIFNFKQLKKMGEAEHDVEYQWSINPDLYKYEALRVLKRYVLSRTLIGDTSFILDDMMRNVDIRVFLEKILKVNGLQDTLENRKKLLGYLLFKAGILRSRENGDYVYLVE